MSTLTFVLSCTRNSRILWRPILSDTCAPLTGLLEDDTSIVR